MRIPIKKLSPRAVIPTRSSIGAAGYDMYAAEDVTIAGMMCHQLLDGIRYGGVKTGVSVAIPPGHYGRIAPRSGLALKKGIDVLGGVIDSDYRGEIGVILMNHGIEPFEIRAGDRIAQLIIERCHDAEFIEFDELPPSERGAGGFGSTGK